MRTDQQLNFFLSIQICLSTSLQFNSFQMRGTTYGNWKRAPNLLKQESDKVTHNSVSPIFSVTQGDNQLTDLGAVSADLNKAISECSECFRDCKVQTGKSSKHRIGLFATQFVKKGEVAVSIPYAEDSVILTPQLARKTFNLPNIFNGWTGDSGLLAALLLDEYASALRNMSPRRGATRKSNIDSFIKAWILSLPTEEEIQMTYPLLWKEEYQDLFQCSSTKNLYQLLDDIEEDYKWFNESLWSLDREKYPEDLFSLRRFVWAMTIVNSRSVFVDGVQRIVPIIDFCNHDDVATEEVQGGFTGVFGNCACVQIKAGRDYQPV